MKKVKATSEQYCPDGKRLKAVGQSCNIPPIYRGVPRIWEGGVNILFFFRFGNLHVAKRHAAHGEAMRSARGVRGHAPPRKFFKMV